MNPAASCQEIWKKNRKAPNGFYWIFIGSRPFKMYCWFNSPESYIDRIRIHDEDRINTIKTEFTEPTHKVPIKVHANAENRIDVVNVALPDKVGQGDPEGAMSMQYGPEDIPDGHTPHFTQPIINHMEEMYWNKTAAIQDVIKLKNEHERNKTESAEIQRNQEDLYQGSVNLNNKLQRNKTEPAEIEKKPQDRYGTGIRKRRKISRRLNKRSVRQNWLFVSHS